MSKKQNVLAPKEPNRYPHHGYGSQPRHRQAMGKLFLEVLDNVQDGRYTLPLEITMELEQWFYLALAAMRTNRTMGDLIGYMISCADCDTNEIMSFPEKDGRTRKK